MTYSADYWRNWYDEYLQESAQGENKHEETSLLSSKYNVCCDKDWQDCSCDHPIDWGNPPEMWDSGKDIIPVPKQVYDDAYTMYTECSECIYYYEPECVPLRNWVRDYFRTSKFPGSIDCICDQFDSFTNYLDKKDNEPDIDLVALAKNLEEA